MNAENPVGPLGRVQAFSFVAFEVVSTHKRPFCKELVAELLPVNVRREEDQYYVCSRNTAIIPRSPVSTVERSAVTN